MALTESLLDGVDLDALSEDDRARLLAHEEARLAHLREWDAVRWWQEFERLQAERAAFEARWGQRAADAIIERLDWLVNQPATPTYILLHGIAQDVRRIADALEAR